MTPDDKPDEPENRAARDIPTTILPDGTTAYVMYGSIGDREDILVAPDEIPTIHASIGNRHMSKIDDVAARFDHWMKNYDHRQDTHSESMKEFITCDHCLVTYGVSYDEYVGLALKLKDMGYKIEWIVPFQTFRLLLDQSKQQMTDGGMV